jgi:hypothetical protein
MIYGKRVQDSKLFVFGTALIALRSVVQMYLDRAHRSTDATDFATGLLMGVGIGMLCLFVWRLKRGGPDESKGAGAP